MSELEFFNKVRKQSALFLFVQDSNPMPLCQNIFLFGHFIGTSLGKKVLLGVIKVTEYN